MITAYILSPACSLPSSSHCHSYPHSLTLHHLLLLHLEDLTLGVLHTITQFLSPLTHLTTDHVWLHLTSLNSFSVLTTFMTISILSLLFSFSFARFIHRVHVRSCFNFETSVSASATPITFAHVISYDHPRIDRAANERFQYPQFLHSPYPTNTGFISSVPIMSFKKSGLFAPNPATTRGSSTKLSASKDKVVYTNGKSVIVRILQFHGIRCWT